MIKFFNIKNIAFSMVAILIACSQMYASSHREAPLIANDPLADNVDLYAFRSPDNPDMITIIATYVPLQLPHGGPNYYTFGENVRYEIHVDNDASVVGDEILYRFTFDIVNEDPSTFFNIRLGNQNQKATYTLERSIDGGVSFQTIITDGVVPPNNIGDRSISGAAGLDTDYTSLFTGGITTASTGEQVFAGPTDDPFFVDLGGIFDLGDAPRQNGTPVDGVACYNVSAIAIQVPIATLLKTGAAATPANILDGDYVIGVWASASRPAITTLSNTADPAYSGDWVQVSRLGMPLTNEAVIPIGAKDEWNALTPYTENPAHFEYFYNPELALYMDDDLFGGAVPAFAPLRIQTNSLGSFDFTNGADGLFGLKGDPALAGTALDDAVFGTLLLPDAGKPRSVDLWPAFHTGVPNVIPYQLATGKAGNPLAAGKPFVNNFLPNGGDMLRLNMAVPVTPRDDANFSSLGLVQAAAIGLTVAPFNTTPDLEFIPNMDGFPNGRRLEDDVTRIELQAVSGVVLAAIGLWYDDYDPMTSASPVTQDLLNVLTYSTGVEANDLAFTGSFPYLAQPHSGTGPCSGELQFNNQNLIVDADAKVFVSSNNTGVIGVYGFDDAGNMSASSFASVANDADGIHYDEENDVLYQLNRSANVINAYSNVQSSLSSGGTPTLTATSTSDFTNGREIAVNGDKLVVAQDAAASNGMVNQFVVYTISANAITLDKTLTTDINLWGIAFDGNDLIAIVDNSDDVAIFDNFLAQPAGMISASSTITVDGIVRTHGLAYDGVNDIMVLTDVGSGAVADDGAFSYITNWSAASADGTITAAEQITVAGPLSTLGNPVDVAYDHASSAIYIAERANAGGRFLIFDVPTANGDVAPVSSEFFQGASAVSLTDCREPVVQNSIVYYSLDGCTSFPSLGSHADYSEFTPEYPEMLDCSDVSASILGRENPTVNTHSCTPGMSGEAMCVNAIDDCNYPGASDAAISFDVVLNPNAGETASITTLMFSEKGPATFEWIDGPSGPNNYPTLYGVRVLKDGTEIFRAADNATTLDWTMETFDFSGADFSTTTTATYTFELIAYCLVGNGAPVNAWDIDEVNVLGSCNANRIAISGKVALEDGRAIENIEITLESNQPGYPITTTTIGNGYAFDNLAEGFDYKLTGTKNDDPLNGVTTLDLVLIQKHILGLEVLDSDYKQIAADVNRSNHLSALDLLEMRKLILGITTSFPTNKSWDVVDGTMNNTFIELTNLSSAIDNADLVAIKYGDVNGSVKDQISSATAETRSTDALQLTIADRAVEAGESVIVAFRSTNFNQVSGFQFTMELDGLTYGSIAANAVTINDNYVGHPKTNLHTMSWAAVEMLSVDEDKDLFTLNLTAQRSGMLSDMISITNGYTPMEAYLNEDYKTVDVKLTPISTETWSQDMLMQNTPNPFNNETSIQFNTMEAGQATFTVYDLTGKIVYRQVINATEGINTIKLNASQIREASSILYYRLDINDFSATKKMINLD